MFIIGGFRPDNNYVTEHRLLFGSFKTVQYADSLNRIFILNRWAKGNIVVRVCPPILACLQLFEQKTFLFKY